MSAQILKGEEYLDMVKKLGPMKIQALHESLSDADTHKTFKQITLRILKEWNIEKELTFLMCLQRTKDFYYLVINLST